MMSDLIARLRGPRTEQGGLWPIPNLHEEASNALEAQAKRIAALEAALKYIADEGEKYTAIRDRLHTALEKKND